jgi:fructose 5-dehydrogenase small subunit
MDRIYRDDAPAEFDLVRRRLIIGGALLAAGVAGLPLRDTLAAGVGDASATGQFMAISTLLIQHHLNPDIGSRLAAAMQAKNPAFQEQIAELLTIARKKNARVVEDFFPDIPEGPLKATALAIISAWYLGVISDAPDAEVFAYELALMYQPTLDVMTIPSYAIAGPNGWNADAPPLANLPTF